MRSRQMWQQQVQSNKGRSQIKHKLLLCSESSELIKQKTIKKSESQCYLL